MKYLNDISYKDCVGKVCKSLNSVIVKVNELGKQAYNVED